MIDNDVCGGQVSFAHVYCRHVLMYVVVMSLMYIVVMSIVLMFILLMS